jgi:uncharacterized membrane protein
MSNEGDRGNLEGPPQSMAPHPASPGRASQQESTQAPPPQHGQVQSNASFDLNQPTIIAILYIVSPLIGITGIVGVILAFVWRDQPKGEWEVSHYQYLINTFWIAMIGFVISFVLMFVLIGFLLFVVVMAWAIVRSVMSLINAQKQQPMPNPGSLLI